MDLLKIAITIVLAILGWLVANKHTSERDINTKRRELVTSYLIDVYRKLDRFTACLISQNATEQIATDINSVITDIQLFGSREQIDYVTKISEVMASTKSVPRKEIELLTISLRNNLRKELGLPETDKKVIYLNMQFGNKESNN